MTNHIRLLLLLVGLGFWSCEGEGDEETVQQSTYNFDLIYENTGITKDENDYFVKLEKIISNRDKLV